jgi:transcriptional regulator with XRE-family HTH domain
VPGEIDEGLAVIAAALEMAEDLRVDATEAAEIERRREESRDMDLLASVGCPSPQYYQKHEQEALAGFLTRLLEATDQNPRLLEDESLAKPGGRDLEDSLRAVVGFLRYAVQEGLLVRIGRSAALEAETAEVLLPTGRRGEPVDPAVLARWTGDRPPEVAGAQGLIDELLLLADRLDVDAAALARLEFGTRKLPAPGRLRDDEDIAELLGLVDAVQDAVQGKPGLLPTRLRDRIDHLRAVLRFARVEKLLLTTRAAR